MVGKNNAALIAQIGAMTTPKVTEGKSIDIAGAIESYRRGKEWADQIKEKELQDTRRQALTDAINSGDQTAINSAWAEYDPKAYAQMLKSDAQRAEDRQWALDDMATKHRYNLELVKAKDKEATAFQRNFDFIKQTTGLPDDDIVKLMYGGQNPTLDMGMLNSKGQDAFAKEIGKSLAEEQIANKQLKTLTPRAKQALERANASLDDGTGLGQIGGWGWTTGQGGINRANVSNAQAQINTAMRGLLSNMGVGSSELNSAAEAEAYRYMIKPDMPIEQQRQVLKNFEDDYLSGKLEQDLRGIYGKSLKDVSLMSDPRVKQALAEGYSLEQIKSYLGK